MQDTNPPNFRIDTVQIHNVGAIDSLLLDLHESRTFLYGGNGVGKTTVLECLSLLGHIPCFPVATNRGDRSSYLAEAARTQFGLDVDGEAHPELLEVLRKYEVHQAGLQAWITELGSHLSSESCIGAVRVVVSFDTTKTAEFCILIRGDGRSVRPTLTPLLSLEHDGADETPDTTLAQNFLVVHAGVGEQSAHLETLIERVAAGRTFLLEAGGPFTRLTPPAKATALRSAPALRVSYVNTDLNDFGRGNDLRESPKNIRADMGRFVVDRFSIDLGNGGYDKLVDIQAAIETILPQNQKDYSDGHAIGDNLSINSFGYKNVDPPEVVVVAKRGDNHEYELDFLSAGENEVFFLLLMALEMSSTPMGGHSGILLLDEPDLHLSNVARVTFFEQLFAIIGTDTQLIICSHSQAPLSAVHDRRDLAEDSIKVMYRRRSAPESPSDTELAISYDPRYLNSISGTSGYRTPFRKYRAAWRRAQAYARAQISPHYGGARWRRFLCEPMALFVAATTMVVLPLVSLVAVVNDVTDVSGLQAAMGFDDVTRVHSVVRYSFYGTLVVYGIFLYLVAVARFQLRRVRASPDSTKEFRTKSPLPYSLLFVFEYVAAVYTCLLIIRSVTR